VNKPAGVLASISHASSGQISAGTTLIRVSLITRTQGSAVIELQVQQFPWDITSAVVSPYVCIHSLVFSP
jgi:hypothetical protein